MKYGATLTEEGARFSVRSASADRLWICLFDDARLLSLPGEGWKCLDDRADDMSVRARCVGLLATC